MVGNLLGKYEFAEVAVPCTRTLLRGTNNLAERGLGTALEPFRSKWAVIYATM